MSNLAVEYVLRSCRFGKMLSPLVSATKVCCSQIRWHHGHSKEPAPPVDLHLQNSRMMFQEQRRHFLPNLSNPFGSGGKKLVHSEQTLLGYSMEHMFDIVSDVGSYPEFVPWCKESLVMRRNNNKDVFRCRLTVGFPPVVERYTSVVTLSRPRMVRSECFDGMLFNHLLNIWKFDEGLPGQPDTCMLDFFVEFEFRSSLHSHLAQMFFNEVVRTMVNAFLKRAKVVYGPPSMKPKMKKRMNCTPSD